MSEADAVEAILNNWKQMTAGSGRWLRVHVRHEDETELAGVHPARATFTLLDRLRR